MTTQCATFPNFAKKDAKCTATKFVDSARTVNNGLMDLEPNRRTVAFNVQERMNVRHATATNEYNTKCKLKGQSGCEFARHPDFTGLGNTKGQTRGILDIGLNKIYTTNKDGQYIYGTNTVMAPGRYNSTSKKWVPNTPNKFRTRVPGQNDFKNTDWLEIPSSTRGLAGHETIPGRAFSTYYSRQFAQDTMKNVKTCNQFDVQCGDHSTITKTSSATKKASVTTPLKPRYAQNPRSTTS
tara:strand:+ start:213 stop:929 length:717 start_codon:yes stop_codon:yes gene_type:complete